MFTYAPKNKEEEEVTLSNAAISFAEHLSKQPVSTWDRIIQIKSTQEVKALLPDNFSIAKFLQILPASQIIFLNSLGSHFNALFPNDDAFPELLKILNVTSSSEWVLPFVSHTHSLTQLIPLFNTVESAARFDFIYQLGHRIHLLDDPDLNNSNIERILENSTSELMLWKYYKGNHVKKIREKFKYTLENQNVIAECLIDLSSQQSCGFFSFFSHILHPDTPAQAAAKRLRLRIFNQTLTIADIKEALLQEVVQLGHQDIDASMRLIFCFDAIMTRGHTAHHATAAATPQEAAHETAALTRTKAQRNLLK